MRADAQRNRQKILEAAQTVFAEQGLDATLDDVAARAGLGIGTVYRRFANKEDLIEALFVLRVDAVVNRAEECRAVPDAWDGMVQFMAWVGDAMQCDRGMRDILQSSISGRGRVARSRDRLIPAMAALVDRAHDSGQLRPDFDQRDLPILILMVDTVASYTGHIGPRLWHRYLDLLLDGLRSGSVAPRSLGERPLTRSEMDIAMSTWQPPKHRNPPSLRATQAEQACPGDSLLGQ